MVEFLRICTHNDSFPHVNDETIGNRWLGFALKQLYTHLWDDLMVPQDKCILEMGFN